VGFVEAVGVAVVAAGVLGLAGFLAYRTWGVAVQGTARICQSNHVFVNGASNALAPPHIDIELRAWSRFGRALTIHEPQVQAKQPLHATSGAKQIPLDANGTRVDRLLRMRPPEGQQLLLAPGDRVKVVLPMSIGGRKTLRLTLQPQR
jgi:hypothetical protein